MFPLHSFIFLLKKKLKHFKMHHVTLKTGVMATESLALHHRNTFHFNKYLHRKQLFKIVTFYCISVQINAALKKVTVTFFKTLKNSYNPKYLNDSVH